VSNRELANVTQDFIFGTLATDDLRLEQFRARAKGIWHGSRVSPRDPEPGETLTFTVTVDSDVDAERVELLLTRDGSMPDASSEAIPLQREGVEWDTLTWGYLETWSASLQTDPEPSLLRYRVRAMTGTGREHWADVDPDSGEPGLFAVAVDREKVASWLPGAVMYHVFVDRFADDNGDELPRQPSLNDIWGGTLKGVMRRLDHIQHLGANAIWLSPIFPSPTHHGYDATDYTSIEPRLGTLEDFDELVAEAHKRGMKVILDFVANHISNEHPAFVAAKEVADAPEREFFTFLPDGSYKTFFGVETMPQVAVDHDPAAQWLIDAAVFWLDRGVDGYRLDYATGPSLGFWTRFRQALREVNPDVGLLGEIVESADAMVAFSGRLDGTLDFLFLQQVRAFFGFDLIGADELWRFVERHLAYFGDALALPTFLDNHDMNRFLWIARGDVRRLKIAALLQMALPGPPIIYYGTEVGLSQWHDLEYPDGTRRMEESRTPMPWGQGRDRDLHEFYRSLVFWRTRWGVHRMRRQLVHADPDGLLLFLVGSWLVVINRTEEAHGVDLGTHGSMWLALATGNDVQLHGEVLQVPAMSGAIVAAESMM
jgi:cyclomaltodextrinase / maltogenic alpha-amylase / neopullulanase